MSAPCCAGRNCLLPAEPGSDRCFVCVGPAEPEEAPVNWLVEISQNHYERVAREMAVELGAVTPDEREGGWQ